MSDRKPPDDPGFAYFWGWVAHEKVEEELYRLIRTTPGLRDQSWMVEDVEKAARELMTSRVKHIKDLLEGWEIMEKGLNKEIATQIFNEFVAGCRTLEDFENRNFSKKNHEQQRKPRQHFPPDLSGNPLLTKAPISELAENGGLPTTMIIYSPQSEDYYTQSTNNLYYDKLFGDAQIFNKIIQDHSRTPNMPAPKVHPMPYHPQMQNTRNFQQVRAQFTGFQQPPLMQFPFHPPPGYQMTYQPVPPFVPMAVPLVPMQAMQESIYAGINYQQMYVHNNNSYSGNQRRNGSHPRNLNNAYSKNDQKARNGYENGTAASSSSSGNANHVRSILSEEEATSSKTEETMTEVYPPLVASQGPSTSIDIDVVSQKPSPSSETNAVLQSSRKFSDVVSHKLSAATSIEEASNSSILTAASEKEETEGVDSLTTSSEDNSLGTSKLEPSSTQCQSKSCHDSQIANEHSSPTLEPNTSKSDSTTIFTDSVSVTSALEIDTYEQPTLSVPSISHRTVAEVVQKGLLSASSSSAKQARDVSSTQSSPAVKSSTSVLSPVSYGILNSKTTPSYSASHSRTHSDNHQKKPMKSPKKPSLSYAQMLYPKDSVSLNFNAKSSPLHSTVPHHVSPPAPGTLMSPKASTDWHTVKNKKAAESSIVSPSKQVSKSPPATTTHVATDPSLSDDDDADVASDDPEAEKKRQKRRLKRQKMKEANRQQKAHEKELARQESLARAEMLKEESKKKDNELKADFDDRNDRKYFKDFMNTNDQKSPDDFKDTDDALIDLLDSVEFKDEEGKETNPPPPAFDRNNLAARRKKRIELQKKTDSENAEKNISPSTIPIIPIISGGTVLNPIAASIATGSPFAILSPSGSASLPLFLPAQEGLKTNNSNDTRGHILVPRRTDGEKTVQLVRQVDSKNPQLLRTEIDENARMIEKLLIFDALQKLSTLNISDTDRESISKGMEDIKKMYVRVEKAGQLISYKTGSSKVTDEVEEKLLSLTIKLLSNRVELSEQDVKSVSEIGGRIAHCSASFNYTNYLTALLDFAPARALQLPKGDLRDNYEQSVVLTKVFLRRTKLIFEKLENYCNMNTLPGDIV